MAGCDRNNPDRIEISTDTQPGGCQPCGISTGTASVMLKWATTPSREHSATCRTRLELAQFRSTEQVVVISPRQPLPQSGAKASQKAPLGRPGSGEVEAPPAANASLAADYARGLAKNFKGHLVPEAPLDSSPEIEARVRPAWDRPQSPLRRLRLSGASCRSQAQPRPDRHPHRRYRDGRVSCHSGGR
jgi:hypothetical protein